jgi:hypothetical protein
VTKGSLITTVRSVGSMPTVFVDSIEKVRSLHLDHQSDQCKIELSDGRCFTLGFHLFCPAGFRSCFEARFAIEDLCGLDLFHSRFAPDSRWNSASLPVEGRFREHLARLENTYAREPGFIERATHLLLVGHRRAVPTVAT